MPDLSRRGFLTATSCLLGAAATRRLRAADGAPCHLLVVTALGGWDVTYALDPKPASPAVDGPWLDEIASDPLDREAVSTFGGLSIATNPRRRPAVSAFFERWAERATVVRGVVVGSVSHDECRNRVLTGAVTKTRPDLAAIAGATLGAAAPVPTMDLGGAGLFGELAASCGRTGLSNQIAVLLDRRARLTGPDGLRYPQHVTHTDDSPQISAWLRAEADRMMASGARGRGVARRDAWPEAADRADALRARGATLAAGLERGRIRTLTDQVDTALDLLTSGLSHAVTLDSGESWDTHTDNTGQHGLHDRLFTGLDRLLDGLHGAALLDRTAIVVLSEMTRTPRRNSDGGKDHWPVTSALLLGGPFGGARTLGASTDTLDGAPVDPRTSTPDPAGRVLRYDHLVAGVLAALDVDPGPWLPGVEVPGGFSA